MDLDLESIVSSKLLEKPISKRYRRGSGASRQDFVGIVILFDRCYVEELVNLGHLFDWSFLEQ